MQRILLLGYFGAGNFGDDALLADWLLRHEQWLVQRGLACDVLSRSPQPLAGFAEGERLARLIDRCITPREGLRLRATDYAGLVAPGGSLLQDSTSLRSLLYYLWLIRRFTAAGRPVFLLHQGIGPISSGLAAWFCARTLSRARLLTVRDEQSFAWLQHMPELRQHPNALLSADPILQADFAAPTGLTQNSQPYALFIPKPTGDLPHRGDAATEAQALAKLAQQVAATTGLQPRLLPFHAGQDVQFCEAIAASGAAQLAPPVAPVGNGIWQLIRGASFVVSYRLHGLVCAAVHGAPALGVAYDPKVSSFCEAVGYPWCFPAEVHLPEAFDAVAAYWREREERSQALAAARRELLLRIDAAEQRFKDLWERST